MENLGQQSHENNSKMHSRIIDTYNKLSHEYTLLFERGEKVNPNNEKHLKMLEDYLDNRGINHNNFFIHDNSNPTHSEEEINQVVNEHSLSRINELQLLIEKIDRKIIKLKTDSSDIDKNTLDNQINSYRKLLSQYIKQYRELSKTHQ